MKKLCTFIGAYAVGLAVAMKLRKNRGISKLPSAGKKVTVGNVVDEVIDIHREMYLGVKGVIVPLFEEIKDFDALKKKASDTLDGFRVKFDETLEKLQLEGAAKKDKALEMLGDLKAKWETFLQSARSKAEEFREDAGDTIEKWLSETESRLKSLYADFKEKTEKLADK